MLRPTRQNRRDPNFFFAISDFLFFFSGFPRTPIVRRKQTSKASSSVYAQILKACRIFQSVSEWLTAVKTSISNAFLNTSKHLSRQCQTCGWSYMCSKNWVTLFHTMSYALWAKRKKVIATLLGRLICHPMREQNCLGGKIFRAGWSVGTSFTVCNSITK